MPGTTTRTETEALETVYYVPSTPKGSKEWEPYHLPALHLLCSGYHAKRGEQEKPDTQVHAMCKLLDKGFIE